VTPLANSSAHKSSLSLARTLERMSLSFFIDDTASDEKFIEFCDVLLCRFVVLSVLMPLVDNTVTK